MQWLIGNRDHRGLSLIAQGEWCDPLNMVGHKGEGVSGWLTIATVHALKVWADITAGLGREDVCAEMKRLADEFTDAAQEHFWDGDWFARGISDDGTAFGVSSDEEGRIWLNPQSWALMSGVATAQQQAKILAAARDHLETPFGPVVLTPSYTSMKEHIVRVTQKHPGTAENGSIYSHAASFYIYALYQVGEVDRAFDMLKRLLPSADDEHHLSRGQLPVFIPNYFRGAVKQFPRTAGRSSQLFNSGAVNWLYRIIIEQLFGLRGTHEGLSVKPNLPKDWKDAQVVRQFRGATFKVRIYSDSNVESTRVLVDGVEIPDTVIRNSEAGNSYDVEVQVPERAK
jgi:cellobionic acid phosphorylase